MTNRLSTITDDCHRQPLGNSPPSYVSSGTDGARPHPKTLLIAAVIQSHIKPHPAVHACTIKPPPFFVIR